ncbi:hypothetical protein [Micromonospora sp. NPDC047187]
MDLPRDRVSLLGEPDRLPVRFVRTDDQPHVLELRQEGVTQTARPATE